MPRHHAKRERDERRTRRQDKRISGRRRAILRGTLALLGLALVALVGYSAFIEPRMLEITEHEVHIPNLPWELDGFTIAQLSDVHVGLSVKPRRVRELVGLVNSQRPDLIVLTGDYVNRIPTNIEPSASALSGLKAQHGVYAVLGNHDYWTDAPRMTKALRDVGIDVLIDESRRISRGPASFQLVGLDDEWEGEPDYEKALAGIGQDDVCVVLAHNPDAVMSLVGKPVSLLIAGHTHGGVLNFPLIGPIYTPTKLGPKYASGMMEYNGVRIFVCRGIGGTTPFRFRSRPEIALLTLRRSTELPQQ